MTKKQVRSSSVEGKTISNHYHFMSSAAFEIKPIHLHFTIPELHELPSSDEELHELYDSQGREVAQILYDILPLRTFFSLLANLMDLERKDIQNFYETLLPNFRTVKTRE